ncbi:MAG TPA: DUF6206 family protein [Acidimicrobiales bacterium]|nr:DUF6206 family protein [Acidimicrobiales bacterium]
MIATADLAGLEAEVTAALRARDASRLNLVGHGELSMVLGWPADEPRLACKRLPPFPSAGAFAAYAATVARYIDELRAAGVDVLDTDVRALDRPDGSVVGYHVQPFHPPQVLGTEILRRTDPNRGHPVLDQSVAAVVRGTTDRRGVDAQMSNWLWLDERPVQLDLSTPFLLTAERRFAFDITPFLASLPAAVRPVVRREMEHLVERWTTPRGALLDMAANLLKERLDAWLPRALDVVNASVDPPITAAEAAKVHASDRRLWPVLLRLQRLDRWWQGAVRRRPYEFLLPDRTTYE